MKEVLLRIEQLQYAYQKEKRVIENLTLSLRAGEKVAVLGANGAGKSTFFLLLNGVLLQDSGTIFYKEVPITNKNRTLLRQKVGIVFQEPDQQLIASTVWEEVSFGPMNLKLSKEQVKQRVENALAYMDIAGWKEKAPHYLSGGEKKRVSIADIIAMESEIMLFDEPTASLDPFHTELLEQVLEQLWKDKKTLVISTHDIDFAYRWAERILVFVGGRLLADGTPEEIFQQKEVLQKAFLKEPMVLQLYQSLCAKGVLKKQKVYPKTVEALENLL